MNKNNLLTICIVSGQQKIKVTTNDIQRIMQLSHSTNKNLKTAFCVFLIYVESFD